MIQSSDNIWDIQANTKGRGNFDFFVTSNKKYGIYYSNIEEYGMLKTVSPVQIWTDINNPKLLFDSKETKFGRQNFSFEYQDSSSCYYLLLSDIIVLLGNCFGQTGFQLFYVLFDFSKSRFSIIKSPNFRLTEISKDEIRLDVDFRYSYDQNIKDQILKDDGKILSLKNLEWYNINEIDDACLLIKKNNL